MLGSIWVSFALKVFPSLGNALMNLGGGKLAIFPACDAGDGDAVSSVE
jgi:hypothetical protein